MKCKACEIIENDELVKQMPMHTCGKDGPIECAAPKTEPASEAKERIEKLAEDIVNEHYQNKISKQIESEAEAFADSYDRRGCGTWQGMFRGYKAGYYRAQEEITRLKSELERKNDAFRDGWIAKHKSLTEELERERELRKELVGYVVAYHGLSSLTSEEDIYIRSLIEKAKDL